MPDPKHHAQRLDSVACAVITISDTRTPETDKSGQLIRKRLESAGHRVLGYEIVPDDPPRVRERVVSLCSNEECQIVLLTGGTGLAPRDTTYEAVTSILEKQLDGFGELFRMLSYEEIGAAAMLSRATAGVCKSTLVFSMPGSTGAVGLAMDKLILPEIGHVAWLLGTR
jgi:molybdenum cofactor biosynthesis protein B